MSGGVLSIGPRRIGADAACFVIAEVGVNHDGDPDVAHTLVDRAAEAGADAVKFQMFDPDSLVADRADTAPYQQRATGATDQRALLERLVLPDAAWAELAEHSRARGIEFLCTPFDLGAAHRLVELGVPCLKVPSGELTNLPFLHALAGLGLPLLVSTGMATLAEVTDAVDATQAAPGIALFHCVTSYPAQAADANLRAIPTMAEAFGLPVGWSDHTEGNTTAIAAIALGAAMLEKHITLDRQRPGPDHAASAEPDAFATYVAVVREVEAALGDGTKRPTPAELENRAAARRSLHATRDLPAGSLLTAGDVVALRPAGGIAPGTDVTGRRTARAMLAGEILTEGHLATDRAPDPGEGNR